MQLIEDIVIAWKEEEVVTTTKVVDKMKGDDLKVRFVVIEHYTNNRPTPMVIAGFEVEEDAEKFVYAMDNTPSHKYSYHTIMEV